jgi:hypothetical protein
VSLYPFGELRVDLEEDKAARAVVFELLREMERGQQPARVARQLAVESSAQHADRDRVRLE